MAALKGRGFEDIWCDSKVDRGLGSDPALAVTVRVTSGKSRARPQVFVCKVKEVL